MNAFLAILAEADARREANDAHAAEVAKSKADFLAQIVAGCPLNQDHRKGAHRHTLKWEAWRPWLTENAPKMGIRRLADHIAKAEGCNVDEKQIMARLREYGLRSVGT